MYSPNPKWVRNHSLFAETSSQQNKIKIVKIKRNRISPPTEILSPVTEIPSISPKVDVLHTGFGKQIKRKRVSDAFDHEIFTVMHPEKKTCYEFANVDAGNKTKRKRKLACGKVDSNVEYPTKKPRLELVHFFGQDITRKEFDDEVFKFIRLCRCESDLNDPEFFHNLRI